MAHDDRQAICQTRHFKNVRLGEGMEKTFRAAKLVGGYALFVDAKDGATSFYQKYGFRLVKEEPDILVLPFDSFPPFPEQLS